MAAEALHFNSIAVKQAATSCANRQKTLADGVQGIIESLADVATVLQQAGDDSKVDELRDAVKQLVATRHEVRLYEAALLELHLQYEMTAASTNFERQLGERAQQLAAEQRFDPTHDELYQAFQDAAGGGGEADAEQIDDDIAIEHDANQLAPNERCPISGKPLLAVEDPVMDHKGFVYEKTAIEGWLRRQPGGLIKCPTAGASHHITAEELRTAKRVIKAQQRAKRRDAGRQQTQGDDVLDVE